MLKIKPYVIIIICMLISVTLSAQDGGDGIYGASTEKNAETLALSTTLSVTYTGTVIASRRLNVRKHPWGKIIDGFYPGTKVEILSREGEWYKIRYGSGVAYVHTSLVSVGESVPDTRPALNPSADQPVSGQVTASIRLNVRTGPWGKIIDGFKSGTKVDIVAKEGDWYKIRYGDGFAYVHISLVHVNGIIPNTQSTSATTPVSTITPTPVTSSGGINGPGIPQQLLKGLEEAKKTEWFTSHKCLQFAGTIAAKAGATPGKAVSYQPQEAYPPDTRLRGTQINKLPEAVESGLLKPGMLIHVKIHYDKDPAYHVADDAHHWFVYLGKDANGVPKFVDNTGKGKLQTAQDVYNNMKGWKNSQDYGDSQYGYVPRITAIHDPFADKR